MQGLKLKLGGVPEHFNLLWDLEQGRSRFSEQGISYKFYEFPGGTGAMSEAVKSGFLDGAVILTEGAVSEISRGANYKIVCPFVDSPLFWGIFSSAAHDITEVSDLKHKVFAISRFNSGSHLMAQYLAFEAGVTLSPDNFYPANDLAGARKALAEGKADLFLWEKYMTRPLVTAGEFRQVGEVTPPWNSFVLVLRQDVVDKNPELISALKTAIGEAGKQFKSIKDAPKQIAERYHIAQKDAEDWFEQVVYYDGTSAFEEDINRTAELLERFSITQRIPGNEELCYTKNA